MIELFCDDFRNIVKVMAEEGIKVDFILADPPYGVSNNTWDVPFDFQEMWELLSKVTKEKSTPIVLFGMEPFSSKMRLSNLKNWKYDWYWNKRPTGFLDANRKPLKSIEIISVFNSNRYYPQGLIPKERIVKRSSKNKTYNSHGGENVSLFTNYPRQLIEFKSEPRNKSVHPTQKPVELLEYLIKTYTKEGDIILDFCMGSGSTGVAAQNLNRDFIGIEMDKEFFSTAKERLNL